MFHDPCVPTKANLSKCNHPDAAFEGSPSLSATYKAPHPIDKAAHVTQHQRSETCGYVQKLNVTAALL